VLKHTLQLQSQKRLTHQGDATKTQSLLDKNPMALLLQGWCCGAIGVGCLSSEMLRNWVVAAALIILVMFLIAGIIEMVRRRVAAK